MGGRCWERERRGSVVGGGSGGFEDAGDVEGAVGAGQSCRGVTVPPRRMTQACHLKCVPPHYKEAELSKGESVCLDRCVAKYLDVHERMGKKLTELSLQDEELLKRMQQGTGTT